MVSQRGFGYLSGNIDPRVENPISVKAMFAERLVNRRACTVWLAHISCQLSRVEEGRKRI